MRRPIPRFVLEGACAFAPPAFVGTPLLKFSAGAVNIRPRRSIALRVEARVRETTRSMCVRIPLKEGAVQG